MKKILTPVLFFALLPFIEAQVDLDVPRTARDQQILDDLIVDGSICVGLDCVNGENFGFKTLILKENNVRLKFFDTSNSASFPTRDWCLEANASTNGGTEHFAILDLDGSRVPFKIIAGAPSSSIFVASSGNVGFGSDAPVVELHVKDGDSPTLRLEQDGSSGFTPQTWDVAGNETNFFVRDATNGSRLPFRIRPNSPTSSIDVGPNGVGINNSSPAHKLHVINTMNASNQAIFADEPSDQTLFSGTFAAVYLSNSSGVDNSYARLNFGDGDAQATASIGSQIQSASSNSGDLSFWTRNTTGGITKRMEITAAGDVNIIGSATVNGGMAVTSDRRLKSSTRPLERGLKEVLQMNPIMYKYTGVANTITNREYAGILAQDLQEIVPEFVSSRKYRETDSNGVSGKETDYLQVHDTELKYIMVNAIKEQQEIIQDQEEQINAQEERITDLEADLIELKNLVQNLQNNVEVTLSGKELGYLGQNMPNPYSGETNITYVLPGSAKSSQLNIYSIEGKLLKVINLNHTGKGQVKVNADNLPAGTYTYQLVVDGKMVETKKMILQK